MLSRENVVLASSWLALCAFVLASVLADADHSAVVWFVAVAGLGFLVPQACLALVDDAVPARLRLRTGVALAVLVAILGFSGVSSWEWSVIVALCGGLVAALLGYEFASGYRRARAAR